MNQGPVKNTLLADKGNTPDPPGNSAVTLPLAARTQEIRLRQLIVLTVLMGPLKDLTLVIPFPFAQVLTIVITSIINFDDGVFI